MAILSITRDLWMFLLIDGGKYTAAELASRMDWTLNDTISRLNSMHRTHIVERFEPADGHRRIRWGVTGLCTVPTGMRVAEVQL